LVPQWPLGGKSPRITISPPGSRFRPVATTNASQSIAWSVIYQPFGEVQAINAPGTTMDLRFPGQWFQLETGLHYNWHRHYDPTTGRYLQPDPLIVDDGADSFGGLNS
jgi:RHS repeat-associated protein